MRISIEEAESLAKGEVKEYLDLMDDVAYFVYPTLARKLIGDVKFAALAALLGWERGKHSPCCGTKTKLSITIGGYDVWVYWAHPDETNEHMELMSKSKLDAADVGNKPLPAIEPPAVETTE